MMRLLKSITTLFIILILLMFSTSNIFLNLSYAFNANSNSDIIYGAAASAGSVTSVQNLNTKDVSTKSPSCILIDAKSGKILYAKNADDRLYPASTTKLMTAILVLENCKLSDVATVSHNAIFSIPVRVFSC